MLSLIEPEEGAAVVEELRKQSIDWAHGFLARRSDRKDCTWAAFSASKTIASRSRRYEITAELVEIGIWVEIDKYESGNRSKADRFTTPDIVNRRGLPG